MALGIDDALAAAAASISLTDTCVEVVKKYRKKGQHLDIELLVESVRVVALERIDDADRALVSLERTLLEQKVNLARRLNDVIAETPPWRPFQAHRLKSIRRSFSALEAATYDATDDIAALVRCRDQTREMGEAIVESCRTKHNLNKRLLESASLKESIELLRSELARHKIALA